MARNFTMIFYGPEERQWALVAPGGLCPPRVPRTTSLLYKYPNIPETLGSQQKSIPATAEFKTTRSNLDTIMEGFIMSIGASPMMRE